MSPKKEIGDPLEQVARTGKIGGSLNVQKSKPLATQTANNSDFQTSRSPSFQQFESPATQTSRLPATQTSRLPATQTANNSDFQQSSSPEGKTSRVQRTIYLSPDLAKWIKIRAAIEGREISELAEAAFTLYRRQVEGE